MRRVQASGYLAGGLMLGLGMIGATVQAAPLIVPRTSAPTGASPSSSSPQEGWPRILTPDSPTDRWLRVAFDPGIEGSLHTSLSLEPASLAPRSEIRPSASAGAGPASLPPPSAPKNRTVPEPASIVLLVTGLIGLTARRYLLRHRP